MTAGPRRYLALSLAAIALAQSAALAKMVIEQVRLLRSGQEVVLRIKPRDPRDPLKGYYAALNYDISQVDRRLTAGRKYDLNPGDTVYVLLRTGPEGYALPVSLYDRPPVLAAGEAAVRGRVAYASDDTVNLTYGIEEYYLPESAAARLDDIPVEKIRIVAAAGADGQVAIKRLLVDGKPAYEEPPF